MDNLRRQNEPSTLDNGNPNFATALNLFQYLLNEKNKGYPYNSDLNVLIRLEKAGYSSAGDLVNEMASAVNKKVRELAQLKSDLESLKQVAISFDIRPGHPQR